MCDPPSKKKVRRPSGRTKFTERAVPDGSSNSRDVSTPSAARTSRTSPPITSAPVLPRMRVRCPSRAQARAVNAAAWPTVSTLRTKCPSASRSGSVLGEDHQGVQTRVADDADATRGASAVPRWSVQDMADQAVEELRLEPGGLRRHDPAGVGDPDQVGHGRGVHREGGRPGAAVDGGLELGLSGRTPPTKPIRGSRRGSPDAQHGLEEVPLQHGDVELVDRVVRTRAGRPGRSAGTSAPRGRGRTGPGPPG